VAHDIAWTFELLFDRYCDCQHPSRQIRSPSSDSVTHLQQMPGQGPRKLLKGF
jgi:hypothetical protein